MDPGHEGRVEELVPLAAHVEDEAAAEEEVLQAEAGWQINGHFGLGANKLVEGEGDTSH